jgi:hypothetical protein
LPASLVSAFAAASRPASSWRSCSISAVTQPFTVWNSFDAGNFRKKISPSRKSGSCMRSAFSAHTTS